MMPIIGWSLVVTWLFTAIAFDDLKLARHKTTSPQEKVSSNEETTTKIS